MSISNLTAAPDPDHRCPHYVTHPICVHIVLFGFYAQSDLYTRSVCSLRIGNEMKGMQMTAPYLFIKLEPQYTHTIPFEFFFLNIYLLFAFA